MEAVASSIGDVTILLQQVRAGDSEAVNKLIPLVVNELRTLARMQFALNARGTHCSPQHSSMKSTCGLSTVQEETGRIGLTSSV